MTEETLPPEDSRQPRRRWFPTFAVGSLVLLMLLGAIALLSISPALAVRRSMEAGRSDLSRAQQMMADGSFSEATAAFAEAGANFADASSHANSPWLRIESFLPLAGRTADALAGLARIGSDIATAGTSVAQEVAELPDGLASLAPRDGRIPIDTIQQLAPAVSQASSALERAQTRAESLPTTWVLGPVSEAGDTVRDKLEEGLRLARATDALITALPDFAGASGTRRYFVAGVNPAELRGTVGLLGVYSILTFEDGKFSLARFQDAGSLKRTGEQAHIRPPNPELAYLYGDSVASSWDSVNLMPDAPTSAGIIEDLWNRTHAPPIDGVIFVDPQALSFLLRATGPVQSRDLGVTLTEQNSVPYLTNKAYFAFEDRSAPSGLRKQALGIAAEAIWKRFVADAPPKAALDALLGAASAGHIIVVPADPSVQAAFRMAGVTGDFRYSGGDFLGSVVNNGAGNKVDFYMRRQVRYEITLGADGSATARAQVILTNEVPRGTKPGYAMAYEPGVGAIKLKAGENYSTVQTYCAALCEGSDPTLDGSPMAVGQATEQGLTLYLSSVTIEPQQTRTLSYAFHLRDVWQGDEAGGVYHLHLQGQPTVKPTTASAVIKVPEGMSIFSASDEVRIADDTAYWSGEVGKGVDLEVGFQKPLVARTWARFREFLGRPAF